MLIGHWKSIFQGWINLRNCASWVGIGKEIPDFLYVIRANIEQELLPVSFISSLYSGFDVHNFAMKYSSAAIAIRSRIQYGILSFNEFDHGEG
jgi:hypothetical protein